MDVGTGLAVFGSAKLAEKLLGPTFEYLGEGLKDWSERRVRNLERIFSKAAGRLGSRIEMPGFVPPRVVKGILLEGSFCEDELSSEYFGGVLASSRTEVGRDDRGAALIALLARLSCYQVRGHYILTTVFKRLYEGSGLGISIGDRMATKIFLPYSCYMQAMDFDERETTNFVMLLEHTLFGLGRETLVEAYVYGGLEVVRSHYQKASEGGIIYRPTPLASELYLWAHGCSDLGAPALLDPSTQLAIESPIEIPIGYARVGEAV